MMGVSGSIFDGVSACSVIVMENIGVQTKAARCYFHQGYCKTLLLQVALRVKRACVLYKNQFPE